MSHQEFVLINKRDLTTARHMMQTCLDQVAGICDNGNIIGYSQDFAIQDVSAFIERVESELQSSNGYAHRETSPYLVSFKVIGGEIDVEKRITVHSINEASAFEQAVREETGNDEALISDGCYRAAGDAFAYLLVSVTALSDAEYAVLRKYNI